MSWREKYADIINHNARRNHLDPALVEGMIQVESEGNPWAARYEPQWRYFVDFLTGRPHRGSVLDLPHPKGITRSTEIILQKTSFGLMQVMGSVAREVGFKEKFLTEMCGPEANLQFGTTFLKRCFVERGGNTVQALIRWNGSGAYPAKVFKAMEALGHQKPDV